MRLSGEKYIIQYYLKEIKKINRKIIVKYPANLDYFIYQCPCFPFILLFNPLTPRRTLVSPFTEISILC